ncbi:hypothetical protein RE943_47400 (plasmid) [Prescottella equi]|uniref:Putative secreted protein n=1 Tax=Rhodococcus hoagii TaxID=43767 RepID=A0A0F6WFR2_RHOHA|nr:hypothetical protein [Prescottella equi]AKF15966.1 putative secreted protein [Prescottella equi]ARX59614.1 putative secreted protein [Prescottella equi]ARX59757.1 putative secreted protein [Prescottella equi]ARX59904.1 putative secreted protein [Prescottella equi]BCN46563.1 hypothetical protein RE9414_48430 [Prescottella equi]
MTRIMVRSALAAVAAAAPLALLSAGTAGAAPEDVSVVATAKGSTVTLAVTNNAGGDIECGAFLVEPGSTIEDVDKVSLLYSVGFVNREFVPVTLTPGVSQLQIRNVADGDYQVEWGCRRLHVGVWGTEMAWSQSATTAPTFVSVSAPSSPFGSASLFGS